MITAIDGIATKARLDEIERRSPGCDQSIHREATRRASQRQLKQGGTTSR